MLCECAVHGVRVRCVQGEGEWCEGVLSVLCGCAVCGVRVCCVGGVGEGCVV